MAVHHSRSFLAKAGSIGPRRLDISYPTTEFTKLVKMWEKFDEQKMGIVVRHIKRSPLVQSAFSGVADAPVCSAALPDYVFEEGERQPRPVLKRPKKEVRLCRPVLHAINLSSIHTCLRPPIVQATRLPICRIRSHGWLKEQSSIRARDYILIAIRHMLPETTTTHPHEHFKENGNTLPHVNMVTTVDRPPSTAGLYTSNVKDPAEIKSPQLSRSENVALTTVAPSAR